MTTKEKQNSQLIFTLVAQYKNDFEEILVECEHVYRLTIDYDLLHQKIEELLNSARIDGIDEKIIWDIIHSRIPSYVNYRNYRTSSKKSA
jgi:hypothetical protein